MWRYASAVMVICSTSAVIAADFEDAANELNTCTLSSGVFDLEASYLKEAGALGFGVKHSGLEVVAIKMEDATFSFDGFVIKFECTEPGCIVQQFYTGWPHTLLKTRKLNFYTFHYCVPESQERIFGALQLGD